MMRRRPAAGANQVGHSLGAKLRAKRLSAALPCSTHGERGLVAQECIIDMRHALGRESGGPGEGLAKRLID